MPESVQIIFFRLLIKSDFDSRVFSKKARSGISRKRKGLMDKITGVHEICPIV